MSLDFCSVAAGFVVIPTVAIVLGRRLAASDDDRRRSGRFTVLDMRSEKATLPRLLDDLRSRASDLDADLFSPPGGETSPTGETFGRLDELELLLDVLLSLDDKREL